METILYALIFIAGLITFLGSVLNWTWMYRSKKSKRAVSTLGLTGARIIYGVLGLGIMVGITLRYFGVIGP